MTRYERLLTALGRAGEPPPADLLAAVGALPPAGELPSPWEIWAFIGLVRHRERQLWVGEVVTERLGGRLADLALLGALGHPQGVPQQGLVPGLPEWEYYFHGKGCCLTHRVSGDRIDVDFFGDSAECFDFFFYKRYLESLRDPEPPERRLLELHGSPEALRLAFDDLRAAGLLEAPPGRDSHPLRLSAGTLAHAASVAAFCAAWPDPGRRLWLAALVGDWPAAHQAALSGADPALVALTAGRAGQCRSLWEQRLLDAFRDEKQDWAALLGLHDLDAGSLAAVLEQALAGPPSGLTSAALDVIGRRDDPAWCPRVHALFRRVHPGGPIPGPHLWMTSLKFLLRHGHQVGEVLRALPRAAGCEMGEACLLALEHAPEQVLPLVRRALLSDVPANRAAVAAILALVDKPWSRRELLAALEASDDQERTADARAALLECRDEEAHRAVRAWEERNPHEPEAGTFLEVDGRQLGPFVSMGELMLQNRAGWIRYQMEKLHDRVMRLRDRVPPEPAGPRKPWWKPWGK
jgi:hypothetical protein